MQLTTAVTIAFAASAVAFPITGPSDLVLGKRESIPAGQQSCTCESFITDGNWYIKIGAPFNQTQINTFCNNIDGNYCGGSKIDNDFISITYQADINKGFGNKLNTALSATWPAPQINGFNCPDK